VQQYASIFRQRAFRWFWVGATASAMGDVMTRVALTWYVFDTTGSAEALGWLAVAYSAPVLVGGLMAGVLLDRFNRRTLLLADSVFRGLVVALVPLLSTAGVLQLWQVYAVAAMYGGLMMVSLAGGPAVVPDLVEADQLATANALEMLSFTLSGVLGPLAAGVLIPRIGAPDVVLFDACSYFAFALALTRLPSLPARGGGVEHAGRTPSQSSSASSAGSALSAGSAAALPLALGESWRLLLGNPVLLATTLMFITFNVGGNGALSVWLPLLAEEVLGGGPELYGVLLGAVAAGEVVGSLAAGGVRLRTTSATRSETSGDSLAAGGIPLNMKSATPYAANGRPLAAGDGAPANSARGGVATRWWSLGVLICCAQALSGAALLVLLLGWRETSAAGPGVSAVWRRQRATHGLGADAAHADHSGSAARSHVRAAADADAGCGAAGGRAGRRAGAFFGIPLIIAASAALVGIPGLLGLTVRSLRNADAGRQGDAPPFDSAKQSRR